METEQASTFGCWKVIALILTILGADTKPGCSAAHWFLLGALMNDENHRKTPAILDIVALLSDLPEQHLTRGQVGTVIELIDDQTLLVEFSDDNGRAYAVVPCPRSDLLRLQYEPESA